MKQVRIKVTGSVQGVFYRANTQEQAQSLGITGWVRNESDGSVSILAQGDETALRKLVQWCKQGPPGARVDDMQVSFEDAPAEKLEGFEIRY